MNSEDFAVALLSEGKSLDRKKRSIAL